MSCGEAESAERLSRKRVRISLTSLRDMDDALGDEFLNNGRLFLVVQKNASPVEGNAHKANRVSVERIILYEWQNVGRRHDEYPGENVRFSETYKRGAALHLSAGIPTIGSDLSTFQISRLAKV